MDPSSFDEDTHICLKCNSTIVGLDNYVLHRRTKCSVAPLQIDTTSIRFNDPKLRSSPENSPSKAQDFFSSLELRSSSKDRLNEFEIDFDLPPIHHKSELDLPSSSSKNNYVRLSELELESNFVEHIEIDLSCKTRKNNYDTLDLEHENLINDPNVISINKTKSILDSDIFSSGTIDNVMTSPLVSSIRDFAPPPTHTSGKWMPGKSGHRKYGSDVHYFCRTCNRRLASSLLYENHLKSELHFKRKAESSVLDMEGLGSVNLANRPSYKVDRPRRSGAGKKKGYDDMLTPSQVKKLRASKKKGSNVLVLPRTTSPATASRTSSAAGSSGGESSGSGAGKRMCRKFVDCDVCSMRVHKTLVGKHLVSHFHCIRAGHHPELAKKMVLRHMDRIVHHAPFQCSMCHFYCNSPSALKMHFTSDMHQQNDKLHHGLYWCQQCKVECPDLAGIVEHLSSETHLQVAAALNHTVPMVVRKRELLTCSECDVKLPLKMALVQHMRRCHRLNPDPEPFFQCALCSFASAKRRSLQTHMLTKHVKKAGSRRRDYFCGICDRTFETRAQCTEHRRLLVCKLRSARLRGRDVRRRCNLCGERCEDLAKLKEHLFEHHQGALHRCETCYEEFAISQDLSRHVRDGKCNGNLDFVAQVPSPDVIVLPAPEKKRFSCDHCVKSFTRKRNLAYHCMRFHAVAEEVDSELVLVDGVEATPRVIEATAIPARRQYPIFRCDLCKFCTAKKCFLQRHISAMHFPDTRSRDWTCVTCLKSFYEKYSLRQHEKLHFPKPFKCLEVGCIFSSRYQSEMTRHTDSVHSEERHFACPKCSYEAKTKFQLKRHSTVHEDEKAYQCQHCKMRFSLNSHLRRHNRVHTGTKPFKCPHCDYCCNTLENLRKHILKTNKHLNKDMYRCKLCAKAQPPDDPTPVFSCNHANDFRAHLHLAHQGEVQTLNLGTRNILNYVDGICDDFVSLASLENYKTRTTPLPCAAPPKTSGKQGGKRNKSRKTASKQRQKEKVLIQQVKLEVPDFDFCELLKPKIDVPGEIITDDCNWDDNFMFPIAIDSDENYSNLLRGSSETMIRDSSRNTKRSLDIPVIEITPDYQIQLDIGENGTPCVIFIPYCEQKQAYDEQLKIEEEEKRQQLLQQNEETFEASLDNFDSQLLYNDDINEKVVGRVEDDYLLL